MDFIDWCSRVLQNVISATQEASQHRLMGVDEIRLAQVLFGEERRIEPGFWESTQRHGMLDAVKELEANGLVENRNKSRFYLPTAAGREVARDPSTLWRRICDSVHLTEDQEQLLHAVNTLSPKDGADHAWIEREENEPLLSQLNWSQDREGTNLLWAVSKELQQLGLIKRDARMGGKIYLSSTYKGLVWDLKRSLFKKCDIFISHITEEKELAQKLKDFLTGAFGQDLKVFVSSDYRSIGGGKIWYSEIIESLTAAPVVLVLLSEMSLNRRWINFEAGVGIGSGSLVIPIVVPGLAKGDVGFPLSALQVRSLADDEDVKGMLYDISGRTKLIASDVDVKIFVDESFTLGGTNLEVLIHQVTERVYDGYEERALRFTLVNNSSKTLNDFRIDVHVPNDFLNQSTGYHAEVVNLRTSEYRVFRMEGKDSSIKILRPGDRAPQFLKVTLVVPPEKLGSEAMSQKVIVKVYSGDTMTQKIEKTVQEILSMPPSFG